EFAGHGIPRKRGTPPMYLNEKGKYPSPLELSTPVLRVRRASRRHSPAAHPGTVDHPFRPAHPALLDQQSQDRQPIVRRRPSRPHGTITGADEKGPQDRSAAPAKEGGYPMLTRRSLLLAGLAAALCSIGALAAAPPPAPAYQIVLRSRLAEATPNRTREAQTG